MCSETSGTHRPQAEAAGVMRSETSGTHRPQISLYPKTSGLPAPVPKASLHRQIQTRCKPGSQRPQEQKRVQG